MKWIAQVGHVARKDVRQTWGMLVLYFASISITAVGILRGAVFGPYQSWYGGANTETLGMPVLSGFLLPAFVMLIGIFATATLVQLDSPTRPNAFWSTRPLSPSAVLTSKLFVTLICIVGVALLGSTLALSALAIDRVTIIGMLLRSSIGCAEWVLAVLIIGILTQDLRAFIGTLAATVLGIFLFGLAVADLLPAMSDTFALGLTLLSVAGGLWFVITIYRTHDRRHWTWIAGPALAGALIIASFLFPERKSNTPTLPPGAPIQVARGDSSVWSQGKLFVLARIAPPADSERLEFEADSIAFRLANGRAMSFNRRYPSDLVGGALPWLGRSVRWVNVNPATLKWPANIAVEPAPWQRDSLAKNPATSLRVTGTITVSRVHVLASLPLQEGSVVTRDGRRIRLYGGGPNGLERDSSEATVYVQVSSIPRTDSENHDSQYSNAGLQFALVNDQRGEALLLQSNNGSGSTGIAILPSIKLTSMFSSYSTRTGLSLEAGIPTDSSWYKGARLVVAEWVVVGKYRTSNEATVN